MPKRSVVSRQRSIGQEYLKFFYFLLASTAVFFVAVFVIVGIRMLGDEGFVSSWRWVHDAILVSIFWYIAPFFLVAFLIDIYLEKLGYLRWMHTIPVVIHETVVLLFLLATASLISQLFGGCIWFYFTEGWWTQFRPINMSIEVAFAFYLVSSVISVIATFQYWKRFVLTVREK